MIYGFIALFIMVAVIGIVMAMGFRSRSEQEQYVGGPRYTPPEDVRDDSLKSLETEHVKMELHEELKPELHNIETCLLYTSPSPRDRG